MSEDDHKVSDTLDPPSTSIHPGDAAAPICDHCDQALHPDRMRTAVVPDSSFVHPDDPGQDGWRLVRTCGPDHLDILIDEARASWVAEQLWFGRLVRASRQNDSPYDSLDELAERASISAGRLRQALRWNAGQDDPVGLLPDGRTLPSADSPMLKDGEPRQRWMSALRWPRR